MGVNRKEANAMRYMMIVKGDKSYEAGEMPSVKLMEAIGALTEKYRKAGVLLQNGGLLPSMHGARIDAANGKLTVTDGPFTEAKELVGGFAIMLADSKERAVELGREFMQIHVDILGRDYAGRLEIRPMFDDHGECGDIDESLLKKTAK
jgi:hypothetical protein